MEPRASFGISPSKLTIWLAVVLLAAGAVASTYGVVGRNVDAAAGLQTPLFQSPRQFALRQSCPVVIVNPDGACPLPEIPGQSWAKRATIFLCAASLCGSGFRSRDTILLLATRAEGSTFWRARADLAGNFRSPLPAPLCRFAPIGLTAFGNRDNRSNLLSLPSARC
jgi:hypothetical protein